MSLYYLHTFGGVYLMDSIGKTRLDLYLKENDITEKDLLITLIPVEPWIDTPDEIKNVVENIKKERKPTNE